MGASSLMSVVFGCLVAGCGSAVQPGLANAPVLGGASPETRVHDAVANGRDACPRAMFPEGGVLRGQVPACGQESHGKAASLTPPSAPAARSYPFGFCPAPVQPRAPGVEKGLIAFPLSPPQLWIACDAPGTARP